MKKSIKQLIILYFILVIIKTILVFIIPSPSAHADYYIYAKMARSFLMFGEFNIHGIVTGIYPPLYSILISISYLFKDMNLVYFFMKFINVVLITSIIFPCYFLAREFLSKKESFLVALLISLIPSVFSFSAYLMAENLFYPLFMFSIYFLYKSFTEKKYLWDILAGLFIGLSYLTKFIAIVLIPILGLTFLACVLFKRKEFFIQFKKKIVLSFFALLVILPLILRNIKLFGFSLSGIMGNRNSFEAVAALSGKYSLEAFVTMFLFYLCFLILASGIVFFISSIPLIKRMFKSNKYFVIVILFLSSLLSSLFIAANHNSGKIKHLVLYPWLTGKFIGRYVDYILPLIFILGFIGFKFIQKDKKFLKKLLIPFALLFLFSSQLVFVSLFPVNNLSLTWLGILNYLINFIFYGSTNFTPVASVLVSIVFAIIFLFILLFSFYIMKFSLKKILPYFMIFFLIGSLLSLSVIYFDSNNFWYEGEQVQLGLWFNEYDKEKVSNVLFDERDKGILNKNNQSGLYSGSYTIIGFWMNDNILIGDVNNIENIDYIVSKHKLAYPILYETKSKIYLYEIKR